MYPYLEGFSLQFDANRDGYSLHLTNTFTRLAAKLPLTSPSTTFICEKEVKIGDVYAKKIHHRFFMPLRLFFFFFTFPILFERAYSLRSLSEIQSPYHVPALPALYRLPERKHPL